MLAKGVRDQPRRRFRRKLREPGGAVRDQPAGGPVFLQGACVPHSLTPGYTYMKRRGISRGDYSTRFGIGYADDRWDSLYTFLKEKGFRRQDA